MPPSPEKTRHCGVKYNFRPLFGRSGTKRHWDENGNAASDESESSEGEGDDDDESVPTDYTDDASVKTDLGGSDSDEESVNDEGDALNSEVDEDEDDDLPKTKEEMEQLVNEACEAAVDEANTAAKIQAGADAIKYQKQLNVEKNKTKALKTQKNKLQKTVDDFKLQAKKLQADLVAAEKK